MKIPPREADGFCRRPHEAVTAVLVHGPDDGLVRERAECLAMTVVEDLADPFRAAELRAEDAASDPALLLDEVRALSLTGGRRVVRIRRATERLAGAAERLLADDSPEAGGPGDTLVVVEAGELPSGSRLRRAFERARRGAAVACYRDEGRDLRRVIDEELAGHGIEADAEAVALLTDSLGADRLLTRNELAKLALYVGAGGRATRGDVEAVVADASFLSRERIAQAVAGGDLADLERGLERALEQRESPVALLGAVARQLTRLRLYLSLGAGPEALRAMGLDPRRHFRIVGPLQAQAGRWTPRRLAGTLEALLEAEIRCKTTGLPAALLCRRALFDAARQARRGAGA